MSTAIYYCDANFKSLISAIELGNVELVKKYLNERIEINATNEDHETPLHTAIKTGQSKAIVTLLLRKAPDLQAKNRDGLNPLHLAAYFGNLSHVKILLKYNAKVDDFTNNANRETALHLASRSGHIKVIKCLLAHGADINKKTDNESGLTVLHYSSASAKTTKLLLESGISVNSLDNLNNNALHKACTWGYKKAARVLVDYKIDVNAVNSKNSTALDTIHSVIWRIRRRGWFVNPGSFPEETAMIIIKVLALKIISKEYINDIDLKLINSEELRGLYYQCRNEIEKMENTPICDDCTVTFLDILTRNEHRLSKILNNSNVLDRLKTEDFKEEFPIYANNLKTRIMNAKEMHDLMLSSAKFLSIIIKNVLPAYIINEVLSYLSVEELRLFLEGT